MKGHMPHKFNPKKVSEGSDYTNAVRAKRAEEVLRVFTSRMGRPDADSLNYLLSDLMHWADREGYDFDEELATAKTNYLAER